MPQSISQAQAGALADGFLDGLGSNDDEVVFKNTSTELILLAGSLVEKAQENLRRGGHIATGKGNDSIQVLEPVVSGAVVQVNVEMASYLQFLNRGVKGTKGGSGEFQFKNDRPGKKMVTEISKWIQIAGLSTRNVKRSVGKLERKRVGVAQLSNAYAVARSIKQKGIKKTGFMDNAIISTMQDAAVRLGEGLKLDIISSLPNQI